MKTATINFKTDAATKKRAQEVANQLGIPLSNLLNAYLFELSNTGSVHFTIAEPMTVKMEKLIEKTEKEIKEGKMSEPFETTDELIQHLNSH